MKTMICIGFLLFALSAAYAQIQPIDHNMKNLKVGNVFIYNYQFWHGRNLEFFESFYFSHRIIRYDTIANKVYAVFGDGTRERADSLGVYWIPLPIQSTSGTVQPEVKEYLRYPLFQQPNDSLILLQCSSSRFIFNGNCPIPYRLYRYQSRSEKDTTVGIFGKKSRLFYLDQYSSNGSLQYYTFWGPWRYYQSGTFERYITTLCGAFIEGKYYGDSACLVASSTPLRGEEFTTLTASLAPNPVSDIATIRFILPAAQGLTVEICDMLGRQLAPPLVFDALSSGMNALPIDVSSIPRGVYAVRLRTALGLRATTMFVKE